MARLVTIPASNFCEKARWGLRLAKIDFVEEIHAPLFHYFSTIPKEGRTVPLLCDLHQDARAEDTTEATSITLKNSDDILTHCGTLLPSLYEPLGRDNDDDDGIAKKKRVKELELYFDNSFGPHARRYAYRMIFSMESVGKRILTDPLDDGSWEKMLVSRTYPLLKAALTKALNITEDGAERSWRKIQATFDEVDAMLGDGPIGSQYVAGKSFTAADISLCSHASLLLGPPQNPFLAPYFKVDEMPPTFRERYRALIESKTGQFVLWCYATHYVRPGPSGMT